MSFEFTQTFDGTQPEIPLAEQKAAGARMSELGDKKFFMHPNDVVKFYEETLYLNAPSPEPDTELSISVKRPPIGDIIQYVKIQKMHNNGLEGGSAVDYRLGNDGIVRRYDIATLTREEREAICAQDEDFDLETMNISEKVDMLRSLFEQVQNMGANQELETSFGLNNQPVGLQEVEAVAALVMRATPRSKF